MTACSLRSLTPLALLVVVQLLDVDANRRSFAATSGGAPAYRDAKGNLKAARVPPAAELQEAAVATGKDDTLTDDTQAEDALTNGLLEGLDDDATGDAALGTDASDDIDAVDTDEEADAVIAKWDRAQQKRQMKSLKSQIDKDKKKLKAKRDSLSNAGRGNNVKMIHSLAKEVHSLKDALAKKNARLTSLGKKPSPRLSKRSSRKSSSKSSSKSSGRSPSSKRSSSKSSRSSKSSKSSASSKSKVSRSASPSPAPRSTKSSSSSSQKPHESAEVLAARALRDKKLADASELREKEAEKRAAEARKNMKKAMLKWDAASKSTVADAQKQLKDAALTVQKAKDSADKQRKLALAGEIERLKAQKSEKK